MDDWMEDEIYEQELRLAMQEAKADAEADRIWDCIQSGECCCPEEPPSRYSPGGIITYLDCCPEHGEDADDE